MSLIFSQKKKKKKGKEKMIIKLIYFFFYKLFPNFALNSFKLIEKLRRKPEKQ